MKLYCFAFAAALWLPSLMAQDRMPPIPADKQTPDQKKVLATIAAGPRGAASPTGVNAPLMRSPEMMDRVQNIGAYVRFNNAMPDKLVEMSALILARDLSSEYLWDLHYPIVVRAGLSPDVAMAIGQGRHPDKLAEDEEIVYNFITELFWNNSVSDASYARFVAKFGEKGVVDEIESMGWYYSITLLMNAARTPPPANTTAPKLPQLLR